jgi:hypothetical protein
MVTYKASTKLLNFSDSQSLGEFKGKLQEIFHINKNDILVHYGQRIFSNNDDNALLSELGIKRAIKLSENHTPANIYNFINLFFFSQKI